MHSLPGVYRVGNGKRTVVVTSGTHGNEPAPTYYFNRIIYGEEKITLPSDYTFYFIPVVNKGATDCYLRHLSSQPDVNRTWPNGYVVNRHLSELIESADIVFDFHEGWGTIEEDNGSIGQSIYTNNKKYKYEIEDLINRLKEHTGVHWGVNSEHEIKGTLGDYCDKAGIDYILVETKGQNDVVSVEDRINRVKFIFQQLLKLL